MVLDLTDLSELEMALLGVLSLGLPPSRAANDDTFRVDHCTAVVEGLRESGDGEIYLDGGGPAVLPAFAARLRSVIESLVEKEVLAFQPSGMPAPPGGFEPTLLVDMVNPDAHPAVLDRRLGQQCLDSLLGIPTVYPFLMGQYARAGEFWRKARAEGYAG